MDTDEDDFDMESSVSGARQPPQKQLQPPQKQLHPPQKQLQPPQKKLQPPQKQLQPPQKQLQPPQKQKLKKPQKKRKQASGQKPRARGEKAAPKMMPEGGKYGDFAGVDVAVFKRFKKKVADAVRECLKKFFAKKIIASKNDFKELCRTLTHKVVLKEGKGEAGKAGKFSSSLAKKIEKYVDAYFEKKSAHKAR